MIEVSSLTSTNPSTHLRWTSADLELFPEDGKRYEIIDGELLMSRAPHSKHQKVCGRLFSVWIAGLGQRVWGKRNWE